MHRLWLAFFLIFSAHPAFAIDCSRAKSETELAICGDPDAQAADHELGEAYNRVRDLSSDDERANLRLSQIEWIGNRDHGCLARRARSPLPKCLAEESRKRQAFLEGKPLAGNVAESVFNPVFIFRPETQETAKLSIEAVKFVGAAAWQTKANAIIDKLVKDAIADTDKHESLARPAESNFVELDVSVSFASLRLLSVQAAYGNYLGQAHPFHWSKNINVEIPTGRELKFDDLLNASQASGLFEYCRAQVVKEKLDRAGLSGDEEKDVDPREVTDGTKDFSSWTFEASGVHIYYGDYTFGGYGQCMCSCTVPYTILRPIANRDFPLP